MALVDQPARGAIGPGIVIKIKPCVGFWQLAAAQGEERKTGVLKLRKAWVLIEGMRDNQGIHTAALHHAHVAVFIGEIIVGDQQ